MNFFEVLLIVTVSAAAVLVGYFSATNGWIDDCRKLGAHHAFEKVYDCKPREPTR
jgi:hypothetical protein